MIAYEKKAGAKEGAEKVPREIKSEPQRQKPRCEQNTFSTHSASLRAGSEAVPLSKTDFFQHPLKRFVFAEFFAGLSPALPPKKQNTDFFSSPLNAAHRWSFA
jgi:hypothetical protein